MSALSRKALVILTSAIINPCMRAPVRLTSRMRTPLRSRSTNSSSTAAQPARNSLAGADGRDAVGPRASRFELRSQAEQRRLVAEAAEEVHADRQALGVPPQRHRHGGVAGDVGDHARV